MAGFLQHCCYQVVMGRWPKILHLWQYSKAQKNLSCRVFWAYLAAKHKHILSNSHKDRLSEIQKYRLIRHSERKKNRQIDTQREIKIDTQREPKTDRLHTQKEIKTVRQTLSEKERHTDQQDCRLETPRERKGADHIHLDSKVFIDFEK